MTNCPRCNAPNILCIRLIDWKCECGLRRIGYHSGIDIGRYRLLFNEEKPGTTEISWDEPKLVRELDIDATLDAVEKKSAELNMAKLPPNAILPLRIYHIVEIKNTQHLILPGLRYKMLEQDILKLMVLK